MRSRQNERFVNQYQSSQQIKQADADNVIKMELDDPLLFDEISNRRKWSYVKKNTSKALKDQGVLNNNYWHLLNHVSRK